MSDVAATHPGAGIVPSRPRRVRGCTGMSLRVLSLSDTSTEELLLIAFVVVTRIAFDQERFGIVVGGVHIFLTDLTLLLVLGVSIIKRPARLTTWSLTGRGAGALGGALWLLCLADAAYFVAALPMYGIYAARDLAIFGYCAFFPLGYFAVKSRPAALRVVRYFVYAGVLVAAIAVIEKATGIYFLLGRTPRSLFGGRAGVVAIGSGDVGGIIGFSLVATLAYVAIERIHRSLHVVCLMVCVVGLAAVTTRAAVVGVGAATIITLVYANGRHRIAAAIAAITFLVVVLSGSIIPSDTQSWLGETLRGFFLSLASAAAGRQGDDDAAFRLVRWAFALKTWRTYPLFGAGFGRTIIPIWLIPVDERLGTFNYGMPHNTFLFVLARMGLLGIGLIGFCWISGVVKVLRSFRRTRIADDLAVTNILVAMAGFSAFVLFFERPAHGAAFWIMLAVAARLSETSADGTYL